MIATMKSTRNLFVSLALLLLLCGAVIAQSHAKVKRAGAAAICGVLVSKMFGSSGEFMSQMKLNSALSQADMGLLLLLGSVAQYSGSA